MKLVVTDRRRDAIGVDVITLRHPTRPQLPEWSAGAHVDIRLADGKIRQYSLCGDPANRQTYVVAIKREPAGRGGSLWLHDNVAKGDVLHVSAPRTNFSLVAGSKRHVFVAGGIGVTPFAAMAATCVAAGQEFELHFCARERAAAPLLARLEEICGPRLHTYFADERRFSAPDLLAGLVDDGQTQLYGCGPARLTDGLRDAANAAGWPDQHLHFEVFQATLDENFKPEPFDVTIASTGETLRIPADRSLLDVLRERGFVLPASCELGVCGTCDCGYRDGTVIHRDAVLGTAARQDRMMLCVSRARVHVTLDL
ncbi:MAG: PDR/VanB family oxidoreductase [Aurantimonas endophytica]|uniref:Vanillate O-demethylase ferredoxin subunit n=1 Tax=Aurantimonas endophytica TaxID=1522175 RepID=A0A7W6HG02_9HYPH|nr:PDR/VanB family oxidoreductase [Aurantimonas endophytica]MBB4004432.1 vanillate O-demethylase ferredoxin subunit [Aurantimonas endophytica]